MSAKAAKLLGLKRACRDLENDREPVALVPLLADARESEARDGCQGGAVVGSDTSSHGPDTGFGGGPGKQRRQYGAGIALAAVPGHDGVADLDHASLIRRPVEPGVADDGPVRLGHHGPRDPGRGRRVLGELVSAMAEDPAGPVADEVFVKATPASALPPARSPSARARSAFALSSTKRTRLGMGMGTGSLFIAEMVAQRRRAVHRFTALADIVIVPFGP